MVPSMSVIGILTRRMATAKRPGKMDQRTKEPIRTARSKEKDATIGLMDLHTTECGK